MSNEKNHDFRSLELKYRSMWERAGTYKWDPSHSRENSFIIDTPPPTVSGYLHMGHVFSYTQADFIARFQRMYGKNVFYPIGFDDNGLPTERLVEKVKGIKASSMARDEFIELCKEVVIEAEEQFRELFKDLALSVDWSQEYQTINDNSKKLSQMSFLDLINKGQAYRDMQPILWDPVDKTALSQADIEDKEKQSFMNDIEFTTSKGEKIVIATTRPELLPACVAVFFNPEDKRYIHLKNDFAITPLFGKKVPFVADKLVNPEKGSGLVMCCPFGDVTDMIWQKKYKLPVFVIINKEGKIIRGDLELSSKAEEYFSKLEGLYVKQAREIIVNMFKEEGLLLKQEPVTQIVKCAERSGSPLEIILTPQWYIKSLEHKEALLKKSAELNWHPKMMKIRLDTWIENLSWDWCISRQRFFGVPFPVWYSKRAGEEGKILYASIEQLPVDPLKDLPKGYAREEVEADMDVMDTWATSSITPQLSSLGISDKFTIDNERHKKLYPADLRPQAHEIIRTWTFYTMLKSYLHEGELPWKNIMLSGWCLAEDKTKMSKSKGNVVQPETLLQTYGSDVVRYWASTSKLGADTSYTEEAMKNGKRLINKLRNAAKLIQINMESSKIDKKLSIAQLLKEKHVYHETDLWIIDSVNQIIEKATKEFTNYEYSVARNIVETFFWQDFCDDYLEIVKVRSYNQEGLDNEGKISAAYSMYYVFGVIIRLLAPFIPCAAEEIHEMLYDNETSIHQKGTWPKALLGFDIGVNHSEFKNLRDILNLVRKVKAEKKLSVKAPISLIEIKNIEPICSNLISDLQNVINAQEVKFVKDFNEEAFIVESDELTINIHFHV